jgi:ADP-heptose:LPS heptosyltransferase
MDNKAKKIGKIRRFILRLLGPSVSKMIVYRLLRKKISKDPAHLPAGLSRCSEILFILPADRVEMIFQLENLFSILGRYRDSNLTFVCPAANTPFVSGLKNARVVKFDPAEFKLFSAEFNKVILALTSKSFDICVLLEKNHTLAHLYLVGMSHAHMRVGWDFGNSFPFLNIRLFSVQREGVSLWERNLEVAKILNADAESRVRWGVPKSTGEEVAQLLNEHKLKRDPALICVDIANLEERYGKTWCAELMKKLKGAIPGQFYIFGGAEGENAEIKDTPFPTLPPMSIPRTAALMACTDLVITGAGALLGLAQISPCKIVPVVTREQAEMYCKKNERIAPVTVSEKPGDSDGGAVVKNVKALMTPKAK